MHKNIEVEIRGLLTKEGYAQIINFLDKEGQNKELDDRKTTFFVMPEKTLKITEKVSQKKAKISLKTGDIVKDSSQTEFEIDINPSEFEAAENIFIKLGFTQIQRTEQRRINSSSNITCRFNLEARLCNICRDSSTSDSSPTIISISK